MPLSSSYFVQARTEESRLSANKGRLNEVKMLKTRLAKCCKTTSLLIVNDCFKNKCNKVFGVFLQSLVINIVIVIHFNLDSIKSTEFSSVR